MDTCLVVYAGSDSFSIDASDGLDGPICSLSASLLCLFSLTVSTTYAEPVHFNQSGTVEVLRTVREISGARFHRAEHVKNVLHVRKMTVVSASVLSIKPLISRLF